MKLQLLPAFLIIYWIYKCKGDSSECSRTILGREGTGVISSYNYPFDYKHNQTCIYQIYVGQTENSEGKTICFTFKRFSLETSTPFCSYDYMKFGDIKYCGRGLWQYGIVTSRTESTVWFENFCWPVKSEYFNATFSSDNNLNGRGFFATYTIHTGVSDGLRQPVVNFGQAPCGANQWTCFNRQCVSENATCDAKRDCNDGSDETYTHARCGEQTVISCDFSTPKGSALTDGMCAFSQEGGEWFRTNEKTSQYGPSGDHTNGTSGYYVYTDGGHEAPSYLVSPELTLPQGQIHCLSFWYYVYGLPASATLGVYLGRQPNYKQPSWSRQHPKPDQWWQGQVTIKPFMPFRVIFGATSGNSFSGVALDDISVLEGPCYGDDVACNFEESLCSWSSARSAGNTHASAFWVTHNRHQGPGGPLKDYSTKDGEGSYALLSHTAGSSQQKGMLISPGISTWPGSTHCIQFWYYLMGSSEEDTQIRVKILHADGTLGNALWGQNGNQLNKWNQAVIPLGQSKPFQLVLEGVVSGSGQIAVDEMLLQKGECYGVANACRVGEFICWGGGCIPEAQKCDGLVQCADGSDEDMRAECAPPTPTTTPTVDPGCEFRCLSDGLCIQKSYICDTFRDCGDGSDESPAAGCVATSTPLIPPASTPRTPCLPDQFPCKNGFCIPLSERCDHINQCGDGSDETANCSTMFSSTHAPVTPPPQDCEDNYFKCLSPGGIYQCIPRHRTCDGFQDCYGSMDEDSAAAGCARKMSTSGIGTSAAVGIALACLVLFVILVLNAIFCYRKKRQQREAQSANQNQHYIASDVSTVSYGDDSSQRPLQGSSRNTTPRYVRRPLPPIPVDARLQPNRGPCPPPYTINQHTNVNRAFAPDTGLQPVDADTLGRQQPGENPYSIPGTGLPPDEPPPPYDAINKDQVILAWDGQTVTPVSQFIPLQNTPTCGNNSEVPNSANHQMTQTPLRRSQRRGSNNRLIDRNSRPSSARSSRHGSNPQVLENDGGSPNLARHRRHGSSGQILDPGNLQRRNSRERVLDRPLPAVAQQGTVPGTSNSPPGAVQQTPRVPPHQRVLGHQRRGSDSQVIDTRALLQAHVRVPQNNLSVDSGAQRYEQNMNSANYYAPPSELSTSSYEQMPPSSVAQHLPRRVLPPMPNRGQNKHLPQADEIPLNVNTHQHQPMVDDRVYPHHQVSPRLPGVHPSHSPLHINTGQLSPHSRDPGFHATPQQQQLASPRSQYPANGEQQNRPMRFPRTNPQLPPRNSPPQAASPREPYQPQPQPHSYGLTVRTSPHNPSPPLPSAPPPPSSSPPLPHGQHASPSEQGPNQPLEILPNGNATTHIWGLDSTTV